MSSRLWALLGLVTLLVACSVPLDESARSYDAEVAEMVREVVTPSTSVAAAVQTGVLAELAFVAGDRLALVRRRIPRAEPDAVLQALIDGPGPVEAGLDVRSAVPLGTEARVKQSRRTVEVDLSSEFAAVGGEEEILAIGQIVVSLTALEDVEGVVFSLEGERIQVPDGTGALTDLPLRAWDFRSLVLGE